MSKDAAAGVAMTEGQLRAAAEIALAAYPKHYRTMRDARRAVVATVTELAEARAKRRYWGLPR